MGSKRSSGGGGGGPAPFLVKTYEMVEEKKTEEVISWGEKGASFVVRKPEEFARDLLPLRFKHNNFSSFVRQLNTYGFRKVVPDRWEFTNDNFRRGEQVLLSNICRKKPPALGSRLPSDDKPLTTSAGPPPPSTSNSAELHSCSPATSSPPPTAAAAAAAEGLLLLELANQNEQLRRDNRALSAELSRAKRRLHEQLAFLSRHVDVSKLDFCLLKEAEEEEEEVPEEERGVKLFGVLLQKKIAAGTGVAKRRRGEGARAGDGCQPALPWVGISSPLQQESSKVCN